MANNNDQNVIEIRESSPSQGSSTITSPAKARTRAPFAPARVSHIRDEAGVTYRVVQIPTDFIPQTTQITAIPATQLVTSSHHQSLDGGGGQQIYINANVVGNSEGTKIAYLPNSAAITVASPITSQPQLQLQAVDGGGGQYYIMIPPGELVQTSGNQQNRSAATMISATATPRIQQAAFIPLSKLDGSSSSNHSGPSVQSNVTINPSYLNDTVPGPQKEVKRRVSHNEVEKRRRDKINSWINKLARLVPSACDDASKQGQSKGGILAKTVDYINELRNTNVHLADSLKSMEQYDFQRARQQIADLTKENKILKQKLLDNNIPIPMFQVSAPTTTMGLVAQGTSGQGGQMTFATKRLIPVTMTAQGPMVIMSSDAGMTLTPDRHDMDADDDDVMDD